MKELRAMTDKEQIAVMIDKYMDLLRIKGTRDRETEIENQLCETRAKLQAFGVAVDDLVINQPKQ